MAGWRAASRSLSLMSVSKWQGASKRAWFKNKYLRLRAECLECSQEVLKPNLGAPAAPTAWHDRSGASQMRDRCRHDAWTAFAARGDEGPQDPDALVRRHSAIEVQPIPGKS